MSSSYKQSEAVLLAAFPPHLRHILSPSSDIGPTVVAHVTGSYEAKNIDPAPAIRERSCGCVIDCAQFKHPGFVNGA
jgi:hypothetical protein